jgi:hypothetical protein
MTIQIVNSTLSIVAAFMSTKQGLVLLNPKQESLEIGNKCGLDKPMLIVIGVITFLSLLQFTMSIPFDAGNFLMFSVFIIVVCFQIETKDLRGFAHELPFFAMNLMMLYMQFPMQEVKDR